MIDIAIDESCITEICGHIRMGVNLETALSAYGFTTTQIATIKSNLLTLKDNAYIDFSECIKKAQSQFEVMQLMKINAEGGAGGAKWLLERAMPKKWGGVKKGKMEELEGSDYPGTLPEGEDSLDSLMKKFDKG